MSKIPRATQKVFGSGVTGTGADIAVFGSLAAGSPVFASDVPTLQGLSAWLNGWAAAVIGNHSPALQDMNTAFYVAFMQLAYLFQEGQAEYDAGTNYSQGAFAKSTDGAGTLYVSKQANNLGNALTNTTWWKPYSELVQPDPHTVCKAWVRFNGLTGAIQSSYNVSSVTHLSGGHYQINFTNPMADTNYSWTGSSSMQGQSTTTSNLQEVSLATGSLTVENVNQNFGNFVDAAYASIQIFGN